MNLTVVTSNGPQSVFCNGAGSTSFSTCTGGSGTMSTGGFVSATPVHQFDVYTIAGGKANVSPSSLTILEDVPAADRGIPSTVTATANHGLINYVQSGSPTGTPTIKFGICAAGTAAYDAGNPNCQTGKVVYGPGTVARIGARVTVSISNTDVYNNMPIGVSAPGSVAQGSSFVARIASMPSAIPARQNSSLGAVTVNRSTKFTSVFPVPAGMAVQNVKLIGGDVRSSGVATVTHCTASGGACNASSGGNFIGTTLPYLIITLPTSTNVPGGQTMTMPTIEVTMTATGSAGTTGNFFLTENANTTNAQAPIIGATDANFYGYPTESTSGQPVRSAPRVLKSVTITA